jgi:hypothetical protein
MKYKTYWYNNVISGFPLFLKKCRISDLTFVYLCCYSQKMPPNFPLILFVSDKKITYLLNGIFIFVFKCRFSKFINFLEPSGGKKPTAGTRETRRIWKTGKKTKESIILPLPRLFLPKGHPSPFVRLFCSFGQATKRKEKKQ